MFLGRLGRRLRPVAVHQGHEHLVKLLPGRGRGAVPGRRLFRRGEEVGPPRAPGQHLPGRPVVPVHQQHGRGPVPPRHVDLDEDPRVGHVHVLDVGEDEVAPPPSMPSLVKAATSSHGTSIRSGAGRAAISRFAFDTSHAHIPFPVWSGQEKICGEEMTCGEEA